MLNCAVVGCGKIGVKYDSPNDHYIRTHLKSYIDNKNCELVAVCDPDKKRLKEVSDIWGNFKTYSSLDELLSDNFIDVLSICSPTETHFENFDLACKAGIKKIWLEKPSSVDSVLIENMIETKNKYKADIFVNYFRRYDPSFLQLKKELDNIGSLAHVSGIYTKGLRNNASHLIDLLIWLLGPVINQKITSDLEGRNFPSASFDLEFEELNANIKSLDYRNFELFELDIIGSSGRIMIKESGRRIDFFEVSESDEYIGYKVLIPSKSMDCNNINFMKHGLDLFLKSEPLPSLEDDLKVQIIIDSILTHAS